MDIVRRKQKPEKTRDLHALGVMLLMTAGIGLIAWGMWFRPNNDETLVDTEAGNTYKTFKNQVKDAFSIFGSRSATQPNSADVPVRQLREKVFGDMMKRGRKRE